jgi:hypothetical protein
MWAGFDQRTGMVPAMTSSITSETFGVVEFDAGNAESVWETEIEWAGQTVQVDLWFDGATMDSRLLDGVARFVADVASFDQLARLAMREDWGQPGSAVKDYMEHHFDDLGEDERVEALGAADRESFDAGTFLARVSLARIGLYPNDSASHAVFDYTTGRELTDNLIAVKFDDRGEVAEIAMES